MQTDHSNVSEIYDYFSNSHFLVPILCSTKSMHVINAYKKWKPSWAKSFYFKPNYSSHQSSEHTSPTLYLQGIRGGGISKLSICHSPGAAVLLQFWKAAHRATGSWTQEVSTHCRMPGVEERQYLLSVALFVCFFTVHISTYISFPIFKCLAQEAKVYQ